MKLSDTCIYYIIINKYKFKDYSDINSETDMSLLLLKKVLNFLNQDFKIQDNL